MSIVSADSILKTRATPAKRIVINSFKWCERWFDLEDLRRETSVQRLVNNSLKRSERRFGLEELCHRDGVGGVAG